MDRSVPLCMATGGNLPVEIIKEIFSRLPVKSLFRFRSVSKSFYSLVIDPSFIKKHLNQATQHKDLNLKRAMLCNSSSEVISCPLSTLSNNATMEAENLYPLERRSGNIIFLGACNGMFCIWISGKLYLWNPSIKKSKRLASPPFPIPVSIHHVLSGFEICAVGYDWCSDDYKVVRIVWISGSAKTILYSLKTDSWRIIEDDIPYRFGPKPKGKFVNGAFHWLVNLFAKDSDASYLIASLDLSSEKYGNIPLPNDLARPHSHKQKFDLAVLRGMLCLYCNYSSTYFVLWAMKHYGDGKSWTQLFKFKYDNESVSFFPSRSYVHVVPKYLSENGDLLLEAKNVLDRVALVRFKENRLVVMVGGGLSDIGKTHVYVESLVSPHLNHGAQRYQ